jgi:transposase
MQKPYSQDLRMRVVEAVEGGASRREAAELYGISPSAVVIWLQRWNETGSIEAKPSGGSVSPLDDHAEFLLGLVVEQPDMTLDEIVAAMGRVGIESSRTAVWRFYERHDISFKKNFVCRRAKARRCDPRAPTLDARAGHARPGAAGLYRRDVDQHRHGTASRPQPDR